MYLVAPLMVGYAAYSLLNQQHRGWYSWVLNSLVGFVYMFGFVMMTPQLFINYKVCYIHMLCVCAHAETWGLRVSLFVPDFFCLPMLVAKMCVGALPLLHLCPKISGGN